MNNGRLKITIIKRIVVAIALIGKKSIGKDENLLIFDQMSLRKK